MLRTIRVILVTLFVLTALGFATLVVYQFTHDDTAPPVITSDSDLLELSVTATEQELKQGLKAYDNMDGDITDRIVVQRISHLVNATDATVTYLVFDNASNAATYQRTLRYTDYQKPRFYLTKALTYNVGETITLRDRLGARDVIDGDLTDSILVSESNASNTVPGYYAITVQVTNSAGDTAVLPLTVTVQNQSVTTPRILLREQLVYVDAGQSVNYASYLLSATDPMLSGTQNSQVTINDEDADLSTPGVYEVYYYLLGKSGETATAILTVVVE